MKRTRHINIRHLYVTNKIKSGDIIIVYHPTGKLVEKYLTKPLKRTPFKNHCNTIMGVITKQSDNIELDMRMLKSSIKNALGIKGLIHPIQALR